jgi:hypothetical protein
MGRTLKRLCVVLAAVALSTGCSKSSGQGAGCGPSSGQAIDEHLVAFLSAARALHHEADVEERGGDVDRAVHTLERLVKMPAPQAAETEEVLADAYARLAELRLERNELPAAERDIASGLEHARDATYFRGHLLEVEGLVEERRALSLADGGSPQQAARARARAVDLFEQAVQVQEQVIGRALTDGGNDD